MTRRIFKWSFISAVVMAAALATGSGCRPAGGAGKSDANAPPPVVRVSRIHRGEIARSITLPGTVVAYQQATLYAKVAGYLKTITVDKGDSVKQGQLLADIEVPELIADLAKFKAETEVAAIDHKRIRDARKTSPDLVTPEAVDNARARYEIARANLDRAQTLLGFATINAPFSGVVTRRFVDPGAFIPAATSGSAPQGAAIVTLMDLSRVRIQVAVPEHEAHFIATDVPVTITAQGVAGRAFHGTVTRFSHAMDEGTRTMLTEIELPNPDEALRPGMYVVVKLAVERKANALTIPVDALVVGKDGSTEVFVAADGKARETPVKAGLGNDVSVEIVNGLTDNQEVILAGTQSLTDGQPIQAREDK